MRGLMTAVSGIDGGSGRAAARSFAIGQRRKSRREEWDTYVRLASLMQRHIDPSCVFWSSLENAPRSVLGGLFCAGDSDGGASVAPQDPHGIVPLV